MTDNNSAEKGVEGDQELEDLLDSKKLIRVIILK